MGKAVSKFGRKKSRLRKSGENLKIGLILGRREVGSQFSPGSMGIWSAFTKRKASAEAGGCISMGGGAFCFNGPNTEPRKGLPVIPGVAKRS